MPPPLFARRESLIGRIRFDTAQEQAARRSVHAAAAPVPQAAGVTAAPAPAAPVPPAPAGAPDFEAVLAGAAAAGGTAPEAPAAEAPPVRAPTAPRPAAARPSAAPGAARPAAPAAGPAAPRRSSVQILLLLVGVILVAVAAIFFLTVAWILAGLEVRSLIIALITLSALATAAVLRRGRLVVTAEGIGALAVVLVLLDAWSLRQNDLFGLASTDAPTYWGVTLVACTVIFLGWHTLSGLGVASVAGFAAAAPGLGLLSAGLAAAQDDATRYFLGFLGAFGGALIHRFTQPRPGPASATATVPPAGPADRSSALPPLSEKSATRRIPWLGMWRVAKISDRTVPVGEAGGRDARTAAGAAPTPPSAHRPWPPIDRVPERLTVLVLGALGAHPRRGPDRRSPPGRLPARPHPPPPPCCRS